MLKVRKTHAAIVRHYFDTLPRTDEEYEAPSPLPTTTLPSLSPPPPTPRLQHAAVYRGAPPHGRSLA